MEKTTLIEPFRETDFWKLWQEVNKFINREVDDLVDVKYYETFADGKFYYTALVIRRI